jgi:hypothetical protein
MGRRWPYYIDQSVVLVLHRNEAPGFSSDFSSHLHGGFLVHVFEQDETALPRKSAGVRYPDDDHGRRFLIHHFSINIDSRTIEKMNSPKMVT